MKKLHIALKINKFLLAVTSAVFLPGDTPLPSTAHAGAVPQLFF